MTVFARTARRSSLTESTYAPSPLHVSTRVLPPQRHLVVAHNRRLFGSAVGLHDGRLWPHMPWVNPARGVPKQPLLVLYSGGACPSLPQPPVKTLGASFFTGNNGPPAAQQE